MKKTIIHNSIEFTQIKDFKYYYISRCGKILSTKFKNKRILSNRLTKSGYVAIALSKNNKSYSRYIHRLIGLTYIPNPENKLEINHKNGKNSDNSIENLEWVTPSENQLHSYVVLKRKPALKGKFGKDNFTSKKVNQYDLNETFIKLWYSIADVQRELNIHRACISMCCRGKTKTAGGFKWEFAK